MRSLLFCCCPSAVKRTLSEEEEEEVLHPRARVSARNDAFWAGRIHQTAARAAAGSDIVPGGPDSLHVHVAEPSSPTQRRNPGSGEVEPRHMTTSQLKSFLRDRGCAVDDQAGRSELLRQLAVVQDRD